MSQPELDDFAALIDHELASALDASSGAAASLFEEQAQRRLADREAALTKRGSELGETEERMRRWTKHLRGREHEIEVRERQVEAATTRASQSIQIRAKTGRTNAACAVRASSTSTATVGEAWPITNATVRDNLLAVAHAP